MPNLTLQRHHGIGSFLPDRKRARKANTLVVRRFQIVRIWNSCITVMLRIASDLKQQCLDAMGVNHFLAWRPREDRESSILRGDESNGVPLIMNELGGRQVTRSTQLD